MGTKVSNGLDLQSQRIINVGSPVNPGDAVTKQYSDNSASGLTAKTSVAAASTSNLTLSGTQTVDGVALIVGNRVLAKNQTTASQNSVYIVASGAWTIAPDFAQGQLANGAFMAVEAGTVNASKSFNLTTPDPITVGTTALTFSPYAAGIAYTAGSGLLLTGVAFSVNADTTSIIADGTSVRVNPAYAALAKHYAANVPAGSTATVITHNLGTTDLIVQVQEISTMNLVLCDINFTTINTVTLTFATAPTAGQYRVVIDG